MNLPDQGLRTNRKTLDIQLTLLQSHADRTVYTRFLSHALRHRAVGSLRFPTDLVRTVVAVGVVALLLTKDLASSPATLALVCVLVAFGLWVDLSLRGRD